MRLRYGHAQIVYTGDKNSIYNSDKISMHNRLQQDHQEQREREQARVNAAIGQWEREIAMQKKDAEDTATLKHINIAAHTLQQIDTRRGHRHSDAWLESFSMYISTYRSIYIANILVLQHKSCYPDRGTEWWR
jgi:hypothetical protein